MLEYYWLTQLPKPPESANPAQNMHGCRKPLLPEDKWRNAEDQRENPTYGTNSPGPIEDKADAEH